jgi:predicted MPP superfamily phosphohydrolase
LIYFTDFRIYTGPTNNLRIAQISDSHFTMNKENVPYMMFKNTCELLDDAIMQINTSGPYDFVVFTGDLINKPELTQLNLFIDHANKLIYPWYVIAGNHDISIDDSLTKSKFISTFAEHNSKMVNKNIYYAFTPKEGYRVICLDSFIIDGGMIKFRILEEQLNWLQKELNTYKEETIILCTHVPVEESYSYPQYKMENDFELKRVLESHTNPVIVLQGHYHATKIIQHNNLLIIACPSLVSFPNAFRVININTIKNKVKVDVSLKETNLKDVQSQAKLGFEGVNLFYGEESDRNNSFEMRRKYFLR